MLVRALTVEFCVDFVRMFLSDTLRAIVFAALVREITVLFVFWLLGWRVLNRCVVFVAFRDRLVASRTAASAPPMQIIMPSTDSIILVIP